MSMTELSDEEAILYQHIMAEFPVGDRLRLDGSTLWVMGYHPPDQLILASKDPRKNYNEAVKSCFSYNSTLFRTRH